MNFIESLIEAMDKAPYPDADLVKMLYPDFEVRVGAIIKRPPRHPSFDMFLDSSRKIVGEILSRSPSNMSSTPVLIFPERWMSVRETQMFMDRLCKHPQANQIKKLYIITSSAVILSDFMSRQITAFEFDDDPVYT